MKKCVELPLVEPLYKTYHHAILTACLESNPTIRNWFLSHTMILTCNRKFLTGFTSPEILIEDHSFDNPYLEFKWVPMQYLKGYVNSVIRNLTDDGYYVYFSGVDDYYVSGKSWYKERHFNHDGTICGYNQADKTYCIYSYNSDWIFKKFWTPQKDFNKGREAMFAKGVYGCLCGIKPKQDRIEFSVRSAMKGIEDYLNSNLTEYPKDGDGEVRGIVVHSYIAEYVNKLYDGSIPYEKTDRRVFRFIWEHKKVMLERIIKIEEALHFNNEISEKYRPLVKEADTMRMLYASHHMKRRDSVLPIISDKLLWLEKNERKILTELTEKMRKELEKNAVGISEK